MQILYHTNNDNPSRLSGHTKNLLFYLKFFGLPPFALLILLILLGACAPSYQQTKYPKKPFVSHLFDTEPYSSVLESSYLAADRLASALLHRHFSLNTPILAASFVSIDNLTESSTFGRIISEQISSRLAQHGFRIIEVKLRQGSVFIKKGEGEFMLSRELKHLGDSREIRAVLVGTYAVSEYFIFVSARIVRVEDSSVLTGYDYEVPNDAISRSILK